MNGECQQQKSDAQIRARRPNNPEMEVGRWMKGHCLEDTCNRAMFASTND